MQRQTCHRRRTTRRQAVALSGILFLALPLSLSLCLPAYCFIPFIFLINNLSNEMLRRGQSQAKTAAKLITIESSEAKGAAREGGTGVGETR